MASASREFAVSAPTVFAALIDPQTYPQWLAGASDIRSVDPGWPEPGASFHHRVGLKPFTIADSTKLIAVETDRRLELAVRARPLVSAIATFTIVGDGCRCVVTFQEEPAVRLLGNLVRPLLDPLTHVRNHRSLRRLAELLEPGGPSL